MFASIISLFSAWMKEEHQRKLDLTNEKRVYWESKIATAVEEIEKFKLNEHILQKAESKDSDVILSFEELQELRENHAARFFVLNEGNKAWDTFRESCMYFVHL